MLWVGERNEFDALYSEGARGKLDLACYMLLRYWRAYRTRFKDRHIVPHTFKHRFAQYQKATFFQLVMHSDGRREPNVYDRTCCLDMVMKRLCPNFERSLIMYIAMFLLPSVQQHARYYGFQRLNGKSPAAAIDVTYVQPTIEGKICTKAELSASVIVHADDLLDDGWDAASAEDGDWAC